MRKICFLIGNLNNSGGTERVTSIISNELFKLGNEVVVLGLEGCDKPFFELNSGIKVFTLFNKKVSMKTHFILLIIKLRRFILDNNIEQLVVVDSISCIFSVPALFGLNVKHICWEHFNYNVNLGVVFRDIGRKLAARYCDYVITLTNKDKDLWLGNLKNIKAQIVVIPNPTPYENIVAKPNLNNKIVLAIGRLTHQKGFDLLIEAWSLVCKKNKDWTLKIVGSGEDESSLKAQSKKLGISDRILFIPAEKEISRHYRSASFYCMSSRFEGFGMVLLEAQSFGLPIISYDCECGPCDIVDNNLNGFLINPLSIQDLYEGLLKMIQMTRKDYEIMSNHALKKSKEFYLKNLINKWLDLI